MTIRSLQKALNELIGYDTPLFGEVYCANRYAGTSGLDLQGALNKLCGTTGKGVAWCLNTLAGTSGLDTDAAASAWADAKKPSALLSSEATWYIDATDASAGSQTVANRGTGGSALNATAGSGGTADANDPKFLAYPGDNGGAYVYCPGVANTLSVPASGTTWPSGATDVDVRVRCALDDWTPAANGGLLYRGYDQAFQLRVNTTGALYFAWHNGSTVVEKNSTVGTGLADGAVKWVRATLDVDNGSSQNELKFWLSDDNVTYTQLGSTVTTAGATTVTDAGTTVQIGGFNASVPTAGKFYAAQVYSGIAGTKVLDIDTSVLTSGAAGSFAAVTGQTVTISRSTSGRKAVAVVAPCWLLGADDYFTVADNDLLDFGASDSFTVLAAVRKWNTPSGTQWLVAKKPTTDTQAGWSLYSGSAAIEVLDIADGTTRALDTQSYTWNGAMRLVSGIRNVTADTLTAATNGTGTGSTDTTTGSLANATAMRVGASGGASAIGNADAEIFAAAVFRRALTAGEIAALSTYFAARCP